MIALLIANTIMLTVALIAMVVLFALLIKAERKLAKYDESSIFRRKGK